MSKQISVEGVRNEHIDASSLAAAYLRLARLLVEQDEAQSPADAARPAGQGASAVIGLGFPRDLSEREPLAALANASGLIRSRGLTFSVTATRDGIRHSVSAGEANDDELIVAALRSVIPGLRRKLRSPSAIGPRRPLAPQRRPGGAQDRQPRRHLRGPTRGAPALRGDEAVAISWTLYPSRHPLYVPERDQGRQLAWPATQPPSRAHSRALRGQAPPRHLPAAATSRFERTRCGGRASRGAPGGRLLQRPHAVRGAQADQQLAARAEELLRLLPPQIGARELLAILVCRSMGRPSQGCGSAAPASCYPPRSSPPRVFRSGPRPGQTERPLAIPPLGAINHVLIVGGSGTGKSSLIENQIVAHRRAGHGVAPHRRQADLVRALPDSRHVREDDLAIIDLGRAGPDARDQRPGWARAATPELVADVVLGDLQGRVQRPWGLRTRASAARRAGDARPAPGWTLADLPALWQNDALRRRLASGLQDPFLQGARAAYGAMGPAERAAVIASPLNKIAAVIGRARLRSVLAQPEPRLSIPRPDGLGRLPACERVAPGPSAAPRRRCSARSSSTSSGTRPRHARASRCRVAASLPHLHRRADRSEPAAGAARCDVRARGARCGHHIAAQSTYQSCRRRSGARCWQTRAA